MSFNKKTTNALSDTQMADLKAEINAAAAANKAPAVDLSGIMSGIGALDTGQGTINTGISGVSGDVTGGFSDLNSYLNDQFGKAGNQRVDSVYQLGKGLLDLNNLNQGRADTLGQQVTEVGGDVTQGFADQTTRFDTLDTSVGDVQTGVDAANTGIETMGAEMGTRFDTTDQNFTQAGEALTKGFTDTQGDVAALQTEALAGQGSILSDLAKAKTERDAYNVASNDAQNTMLENQTGFKTNFDDYVKRYSDNTTIQNETLGGIQSGLTGFAGDVNNSLASLNSTVDNNAAAAAAANAAQANSVEKILQGGFNTLGTDLSGVDQNVRGLANGISQGQGEYSNQFEQVTGQLKSLSQLSGLPDQMRQQFYQLGGSFDKQGNLIQNSIDEQGNTITRALDNQGNMMIRKFDASGASMGQMAMNLNDVMGQINQLGLVPGGNAGMGNLSQPLQDLGTGNGGFMSPFGRTQ